METYAGFAEHTDHEVGRLVQALEEMGVMDNTLLIYIVGDNGASAEGGPEGAYNEMMALNGIISTAAINMPHINQWGDPSTFPHYAIGWAWAGDTPFQWTKQIASHFGGTRNGMVMHWPKRIKARGEIRSQFSHVTDIAPTALEAASLPFPKMVNGTQQRPFDGTSLVYTFDDAKAKATHTTQYFEMFGNRELYHVDEDFSEANNLAEKNPEKLKELQDLFMKEAVKNSVLPIDDRRSERFNPAIAGRPDIMGSRTSLTVYPGMVGMTENAFINVKNRSHTITADLELANAKTSGVIIAQAGRFGGWTLYMKDGKVHYEYNFFGVERTKIASTASLPAGKHVIKFQYEIDQPKPGTGGKCILFVDDKKVAEGHIPKTEPFAFSGDEGADVGMDAETAVSDDYKQGDNKFTGKINKVTIDLGPSKLSGADEKKVEEAGDIAATIED